MLVGIHFHTSLVLELTVNNSKAGSLLSLRLPALHLRVSFHVQERSLLQAQNEISPCASLNEGSDSPPAGVSVVLWSAAGS